MRAGISPAYYATKELAMDSPPTASATEVIQPRSDRRRRFADCSLRVKLLLAFLAGTGLSIGIIAFVATHATQSALSSDVDERLQTLATLKAEVTGDVLT